MSFFNPNRAIAKSAFTLIELLIVVLIIAILAAIAVPNFLEFQVRAKIARVKSDHRAIATAMEAYLVDWNVYINDQDNNPNSNNENGYRKLTTPIAYISGLAHDPFSRPLRGGDKNYNHIAAFYEIGSGADATREGDRFPNRYVVQCYYISSFGPDHMRGQSNDDFPFGTSLEPYDPTNGTMSEGDIYRFGGNYNEGDWEVFKIDHNLWRVPTVWP